jgi:hypothetical protein
VSATAVTGAPARDRSPSIVSSTSTLESIREKIRQKRISLRRGLGLVKNRTDSGSESDESKETQPQLAEISNTNKINTVSRTRTRTVSGTSDSGVDGESMANKYKRFSRVRHIFVR